MEILIPERSDLDTVITYIEKKIILTIILLDTDYSEYLDYLYNLHLNDSISDIIYSDNQSNFEKNITYITLDTLYEIEQILKEKQGISFNYKNWAKNNLDYREQIITDLASNIFITASDNVLVKHNIYKPFTRKEVKHIFKQIDTERELVYKNFKALSKTNIDWGIMPILYENRFYIYHKGREILKENTSFHDTVKYKKVNKKQREIIKNYIQKPLNKSVRRDLFYKANNTKL